LNDSNRALNRSVGLAIAYFLRCGFKTYSPAHTDINTRSQKRVPTHYRPPRQPSRSRQADEGKQIKEGLEAIAVDEEVCGIVARNWPHLLPKLPPEEE